MSYFVSDVFAADAPATTTAGTQTTDANAVPYDLSPQKMLQDNLLILGLIFFIFYFLLIRPQQKRVKMQQELHKGLEKGNRVITTGGLIGTISKFEGDDVVIIEVAPNVKVRVARAAITEKLDGKAPAESANDN